MPPRDLRKDVQTLGANSQPGEQAEAQAVIYNACASNKDLRAAVVAFGGIPLLVPLLGPGYPAQVHIEAAGTLSMINVTVEDAAVTSCSRCHPPTGAAYGACPSSARVQVAAAMAIMGLARHTLVAPRIVAAGAIPLLVQLLDPRDGPPAGMQKMAAGALCRLAVNAADAAIISGAGAIPLLVGGGGC
jgi:hypothetical protein